MHIVTRLCPSAILIAAFLHLPTVHANEICAYRVVLKPGESWGHLLKLSRGSYTCRAAAVCGSGDQLRIEAESLGGTRPARTRYRNPTNEITFDVSQDGETWKITYTNTSASLTLSFTAVFTSAHFTPPCHLSAPRKGVIADMIPATNRACRFRTGRLRR